MNFFGITLAAYLFFSFFLSCDGCPCVSCAAYQPHVPSLLLLLMMLMLLLLLPPLLLLLMLLLMLLLLLLMLLVLLLRLLLLLQRVWATKCMRRLAASHSQ